LLKAPLAFTFVPSGPITWLIIIVAIAALASYLPARNAARVEVQTLLAYE
jgi:putative ABC transport system permease protein